VDATKQFVVETRGWAPPPTTRPDLPFTVDRAGVGQGVPVYTDYKAGGTKVVTITRKVRGDVLLLAEELQKIVGDETEVHPLTYVHTYAHSLTLTRTLEHCLYLSICPPALSRRCAFTPAASRWTVTMRSASRSGSSAWASERADADADADAAASTVQLLLSPLRCVPHARVVRA